MATIIAQASTSSGASNASDFQPPTRNPQAAPGQIFPESDNIQQPSTDAILRNPSLRINVPSNPAPQRNEITEAKSGIEGLLLALVIVTFCIGVILWRKRRPAKVITDIKSPSAVTDQPIAAPIEPTNVPIKPVSKKNAPKRSKSKSKRKKRARR